MLTLSYLAELAERHANALNSPVARFQLRGEWIEPYPNSTLMGVVNLSSDSWYRESVSMNLAAAERRAHRLAIEGAKIIDIGAESTVLQALRVDAQTQNSLLVPLVQTLSSAGLLISVETYHPEVTAACLSAGAAVINLTSAQDTEVFYRLAAEYDAGVIICYIQNGKNVREVSDFQLHADHTGQLYEYFAREIDKATLCGVSRLWLDAGLGFYYKNLTDSAQRVSYQMETFLNSFRLRTLGFPVCQALPHAFEYFEEEVRCAESFFGVLALLGQVDLLRTHEVAKVRGVLETLRTLP